jgi:hypothetical protein
MFFTACGQGPDFLRCSNDANGRLMLAPALKPLERHAAKLLVLSGVNNQAALHDGAGIDAGHKKPSLTVTTCVATRGGAAAGISIDQAIAAQVSMGTKIPSLELNPYSNGSLSWKGPGAPMSALGNPSQVFAKMFSGAGTRSSDLSRIAAERRSILDSVKQDYTAFMGRLGAEDQRKIESHLEAIREVESRIGMSSPTGSSCKALTAPTGSGDEPYIALLALAFSCDVSRVGSLVYGGPANNAQGLHDASHIYGPSGHAGRNAHSQRFAGRFAALLDKLAGIDEQGRSVLDNSIVYWYSEHGAGTHNYDMMPIIVAGSGGGYFRTGRNVKYPNGTDGLGFCAYSCKNTNGPSQSELYVSFMNAMGIEAQSFGDPKLCRGPLPDLT